MSKEGVSFKVGNMMMLHVMGITSCSQNGDPLMSAILDFLIFPKAKKITKIDQKGIKTK